MKIVLVISLLVATLALLFATVGLVIGSHAKYGSKAEKISEFLMDIAMGILIACIFGVLVTCVVAAVNTL